MTNDHGTIDRKIFYAKAVFDEREITAVSNSIRANAFRSFRNQNNMGLAKQNVWNQIRGLIGMLIVMALGIVLIVLLSRTYRMAAQGNHSLEIERAAMERLRAAAESMIAGGSKGIAYNGNARYISTYDAFFDYMAANQPALVSSSDANNPFPGILKGTNYIRLSGVAHDGQDVLLSSQPIDRPNGSVRYFIRCDGSFGVTIKN